MKRPLMQSKLANEDGAVAIVVALVIFLLLGFAALSLDIGHLCVVQGELKNAADAGALAGARFLYNDEGTLVNVGANQIAIDAATANKSENESVEVNAGEVQRGHWSFGLGDLARGFYPNSSIEPVDLWDVSTEQLDANLNFINAIRVVTRRESFPIISFFARIFGHESFQCSSAATGYIGFAGSLEPGEADQPIAVCEESIEIGDEFSCNIGRMLNSGGSDVTHNTAGWTNFTQPCSTASASEMQDLVCGDGNPDEVEYGEYMGATGGTQQVTFNALRDCWIIGANDTNGDGFRETPIDTDGNGIPDQPWELRLPVISCPGNNVENCALMTGVVNLEVVWMTEAGTPDWDDVPWEMAGWSSSTADGQVRWAEFVDYFNLKNADGEDAPYAFKSIYYLPVCTYHKPTGITGGENYGVLAEIPVLVK